MESLPSIDETTAERLVDTLFPTIRPAIERMWFELADEIKLKAKLKPKKK